MNTTFRGKIQNLLPQITSLQGWVNLKIWSKEKEIHLLEVEFFCETLPSLFLSHFYFSKQSYLGLFHHNLRKHQDPYRDKR